MTTCTTTIQIETKGTQEASHKAEQPCVKFESSHEVAVIQETDNSGVNELPPPSTAVSTAIRWNNPQANAYRLFAVFYGFLVFGLSDAAYGALLPYIETHYHLSYTVVSLIFLSPFLGYSLAAFSVSTLHLYLGQRGLAVIAPTCRFIPYIVISLHPPYPALVVSYAFVGYGNGLEDAGWSAWVGNMANGNRLTGFMHAFYAGGATLSPYIATAMVTKAGLQWYEFYYMMAAAALVELVTSSWTFWPQNGRRYREESARQSEDQGGLTREALRNKVTWICSIFFFAYVGVEVTMGGWIVTFMAKVRSASPYHSGISASGFWAGMTVGRASLGYFTDKFGERLCVVGYLAAALALELVFWLVPKFVVSAIAVAFLGFFFGPLFPAGIVMATKLLPLHLHVSAVGFATAIGGTGGALFPFATGAIAQAKGVEVLQPIVLALIVVVSITWLSLPKIKKREDD